MQTEKISTFVFNFHLIVFGQVSSRMKPRPSRHERSLDDDRHRQGLISTPTIVEQFCTRQDTSRQRHILPSAWPYGQVTPNRIDVIRQN